MGWTAARDGVKYEFDGVKMGRSEGKSWWSEEAKREEGHTKHGDVLWDTAKDDGVLYDTTMNDEALWNRTRNDTVLWDRTWNDTVL